MYWERPLYEPGGGKPFFFYALFGSGFADLQVSEERHRASGIPAGIQFVPYDIRKDSETMTMFYSNQLGELLRAKGDDVFRRVALSPACLVIVGELEEREAASLDYLRNMIGIVQAALEQGAAAVLDTQSLRWYTAQEWHETMFAAGRLQPLEQTSLLVTAEGDGLFRLHTRGMRKFGRPDISVRGVPEPGIPAVTSLVNRLVELQAAGMCLQAAASTVVWQGVEWTLTGCRDTNFHNPDFNNESLEYTYDPNWAERLIAT